jgi:hypothetical protein
MDGFYLVLAVLLVLTQFLVVPVLVYLFVLFPVAVFVVILFVTTVPAGFLFSPVFFSPLYARPCVSSFPPFAPHCRDPDCYPFPFSSPAPSFQAQASQVDRKPERESALVEKWSWHSEPESQPAEECLPGRTLSIRKPT